MAVTNRTSSAITDAVAVPRVPVNPHKGAPGEITEVAGYVTPAADDSATSVHRYCRVPSNASVRAVKITHAVAGTAGAMDIGIYQTAANGSAVVDADLFASNLVLTGSARAKADITDESGEYSLDEQVKPLWEVLGLSADPHREYDVAATLTSDFSSGPTKVLLQVQYVK